jgi:periplasmic protein TonB
MSLDSQEVGEVSEKLPNASVGSLGGCLVDGDAEQRHRERRVRRRALVLSILIQTAVLALLVQLPLFGKTEHIALAIATPIPSYGHPPHSAGATNPRPGHPANPGIHYIFSTPTIRPSPPSNAEDDPVGPPEIGSGGNEQASGPACSWCVNIGDRNTGPRPPQPVTETLSRPRVIQKTSIDPAMLIRRVEPIYPPLARQIHKEGRVEMRARIATDGTIQSLEIVSGDPIFYQSAKEAVSQWLYRPTVLNGQMVEIDTYITVVYIMQH